MPVMQSAFLQQWIVTHLNHSSSLPLQELELLGSMAPAQWANVSNQPNCSDLHQQSQWLPWNGTGVTEFGNPWHLWLHSQGERQYTTGYQNVSGNSRHWNFSLNNMGRFSVNTSGGFLLPSGYFLICGDRAWGGIPVHPVGGPCYIGKLTLFTPRIRDFLSLNKTRSK